MSFESRNPATGEIVRTYAQHTAADIEALGEEVRRRVKAATGITLGWEIRRTGVPARTLEPRP